MCDDIYIPDRFRRVVSLHIVKNLLKQNTSHTPLLLGIHGPSEDGKTYQCECVLKEMGAKVFLISGGQLESENAGEPANLIRTTYLKAGKCIQKEACDKCDDYVKARCAQKGESKVAVIMINDIDTGLGSWGDMVQYTINRQTVIGELMHLVDYPTSVEGRKTERIPIIITGNDFTKLYEPLVRAGRMTSFEWHPNLEEKVEIISRIFPEIKREETIALVDMFQHQSVAFFSHLRWTLIDDILWQEIQKLGLLQVINRICNDEEPHICLNIQYNGLVKAGKALLQSGQLISHLRSK